MALVKHSHSYRAIYNEFQISLAARDPSAAQQRVRIFSTVAAAAAAAAAILHNKMQQ